MSLNFFNQSILILLTGITFFVLPVNYLHGQSKENLVEIINLTELNELLSERNNKPLLINVWATWCVPCREEFPDLIAIADKYNTKIDVIGLSVDFSKEMNSKVIPFLEKFNPGFPNFIVDVNDPEELINLLNAEWNGAIPATFLFSSDGKLVQSIIGKSDLEGFEKLISGKIN